MDAYFFWDCLTVGTVPGLSPEAVSTSNTRFLSYALLLIPLSEQLAVVLALSPKLQSTPQ